VTNQIRIGLASCSRRSELVSTTHTDSAQRVTSWLAVVLVAACAGLVGCARLLAQTSSAAPSPSTNTAQSVARLTASAIQIEPVEIGDVKIPPEFRAAVYENLIGEVTKARKFQHVYRSGDRAAGNAPDLVTVRMKVMGFKRGSQRTREVTTLAGATTVSLGVQVSRRDGNLLVDREVEGRVRFFGGNLRATYDFSKKVTAILRQSF
jgi:hypothetical protein